MSPRSNIFPALRYENAPAAIDWLVDVFGFARHAVFANDDGTVAHAQLRLGTAVVGLSSAHRIAASPWSEVRQGVYVCVRGIDAHYECAVAAGASIVMPIRDTEYGSREYGARDSEGHLWGFGTWEMDAPIGLPAVFPAIHYRDGEAALRFLKQAFGFEPVLVVPGLNGSIRHAEMALGDGIFMFGSGPDDEIIWRGQSHATNVYVADPDAHFMRARTKGADIVNEPRDSPWGSRGYGVRDLEGLLWGFSTYQPARSAV